MKFTYRIRFLWFLLTDPEARAIVTRAADKMADEQIKRWCERLDAKIRELEQRAV